MEKLKSDLKKQSRILLSILMVMAMVFTIGCNDDDDDNGSSSSNIMEVLKSDPDLSTLVNAITAANLESLLSDGGPFTLFAPTNAAFAQLDPDVLNTIISTPSLLTALLQYHLVNGELTSPQISSGSLSTNLAGQSIDVVVENFGIVLNGSSNVIMPDVDASNGVVHHIDEVLMPEDFTAQTIAQVIGSMPDYSILLSALAKPELSDLLAAANDPASNLTVFAPNNEAFNAVLAALGKSSIDELPVGLLKEIVSYHIAEGALMSDELTTGLLLTLLPEESLEIEVGDGVKVNDANVTAADMAAINGVIHGVDGVLLPSYAAAAVGKITELVLFDPDYTILANTLRTAELLDTLSMSDNLTLFAPDNAAFVAAGITSTEGLDKETLTPILLYHVLGAKVMSSELPADGMAMTLNNDEYMYLGYLYNSAVLINGLTNITGVDMEKDNGVVHTIDRTLLPPAGDIVDIAVALADMGDDSEFTVLVSLLASDDYSDIATAIKDAENITLFAPTDSAFSEISGVIDTLTVEQIRNVLTYHATPARVFSSGIVAGQTIGMLNGQTLEVVAVEETSITLKDKTDDNGMVIEVNVHGSNGVIHVVDKVLIPDL